MPTTLTGEVERVTYENEATGFRVIRIGSLEGGGARRGALPAVGTFLAVLCVLDEFPSDADPRPGNSSKTQSTASSFASRR